MSIAKRWLPAGDKYEASVADYVRTRMHEAKVSEEEQKDVARSVVSTWTENEIEKGFTPVLENFLDQSPEWDRPELHDTLEAEMNRVTAIRSDVK